MVLFFLPLFIALVLAVYLLKTQIEIESIQKELKNDLEIYKGRQFL